MAKHNKKNIKDIQSALLSNTDFLNKENSFESEENHQNVIDQDTFEKFDALAKFEKTTTEELLNKALRHYLKLKGLQLEQALQAKNKK